MRYGSVCLIALLLAGFGIHAQQDNKSQEKPKDNPPAAAEAAKPAGEGKNPIKLTPEATAAVKKIYGYDCAMCHGAAGDGKGDLAGSMNLTLKDWREPAALHEVSDEEMYELIVKGKGKMVGEGERLNKEQARNMVAYVRMLAKKDAGDKTPAAAPKP